MENNIFFLAISKVLVIVIYKKCRHYKLLVLFADKLHLCVGLHFHMQEWQIQNLIIKQEHRRVGEYTPTNVYNVSRKNKEEIICNWKCQLLVLIKIIYLSNSTYNYNSNCQKTSKKHLPAHVVSKLIKSLTKQ